MKVARMHGGQTPEDLSSRAPGNAPFQRRSYDDNDPLQERRSNNSPSPSCLVSMLPISRSGSRGVRLRKRVNGEVNDGEVLINGSTMGAECAWRFSEAGGAPGFCNPRNARTPPTRFNPPKYVHYPRFLRFFFLFFFLHV